ncbi:hypothetical protein [Rhodoferax ferrireducens]|uniref:hypothetical protein n=1 Tax=Rhodoferax ferrireducens TaxID=192843 RepID=UPI001300A701|nr:hypothetical protein [Rhodoferax ferrireducens]
MRSALFLTLALSCTSFCWAQAPAPAQAASPPPKSSVSAQRDPVEKRTERIHLEDKGSRIDELRVGGETKSIDVQPKGGMPAYQVQPASGERSWKILGF